MNDYRHSATVVFCQTRSSSRRKPTCLQAGRPGGSGFRLPTDHPLTGFPASSEFTSRSEVRCNGRTLDSSCSIKLPCHDELMIPLTQLSASDLRRAADLKELIENLQKQLTACLSGGDTDAPFPTRRQRQKAGRNRRSAKGGKTVSDCILDALGDETLPIRRIIIRASQIRGKPISPGLLSFTLAQLKKSNQVANPARGQYKKA